MAGESKDSDPSGDVVNLMSSYGCNCAEAVVKTLALRFGFDPGLSRLVTVFGGGVSHKADLCGLLTGGLVVISLRMGRVDCGDIEKKERTYKMGAEFYEWFLEEFGRCSDIIGDPDEGDYNDCYLVVRKAVPKLINILEEGEVFLGS